MKRNNYVKLSMQEKLRRKLEKKGRLKPVELTSQSQSRTHRRGCVLGSKRGPYKKRDKSKTNDNGGVGSKLNKSCLNDIIPDRFEDEISDTFFNEDVDKNLDVNHL